MTEVKRKNYPCQDNAKLRAKDTLGLKEISPVKVCFAELLQFLAEPNHRSLILEERKKKI
jgi:hypothetical protein